MDVSSNLAQPVVAVNNGLHNHGINSTQVGSSNSQTPPVPPTTADILSITQSNISLARLVMTQQIDIALQINNPTGLNPELNADGNHHADNLVNKVLNKIHDNSHEDNDTEFDQAHHEETVKSVQINVNQGFEQSVIKLNQLGILNSSVASEVSQTQSQVNQAINQVAANPTSAPGLIDMSLSTRSASFNSASATHELSTSVQLTTKEGDVVTINLTRSQSLAAGSFQDSNGALLYASSSAESQLSINIQGDLTEKESNSIKEVIEDIGKLAKKMFNGELSDAMEKLSELDIDTKQLSGLALSMSSNISFEAISAYTQVSQMTVNSSPASAPLPNSITSVPATDTAVAGSSNDFLVDQNTPSTMQASVEQSKPASMVVVDVASETADIVRDANLSNSFENPFMEINKLFDQLAELFSFKQDNTKNFIKDLFHDLVEQLEEDEDT